MCRSRSSSSQANDLVGDRCYVGRVTETAQFRLETGPRTVEACVQERNTALNVGRCCTSAMCCYRGAELQSLRTQAHHFEGHVGRRMKRELYRSEPFSPLRFARLWQAARGEELHRSLRFNRLDQFVLHTSKRSCGFHELRPVGN